MTAEIKKGKYVYYRCTDFKGACGNAYIREERLSELLGDVIAPIQITDQIASEDRDRTPLLGRPCRRAAPDGP